MKQLIRLGLMSVVLGCSDDPDVQPADVPDAEACGHLESGPSTSVIATATVESSTPAVTDNHRRYDVGLEDVGGGEFGGYVTFAATHTLRHYFFLNADVPLQITRDPDSTEVAPEENTASSGECGAVKRRLVVPLEEQTYRLHIGPTAATSVGLVIEPAPHDH